MTDWEHKQATLSYTFEGYRPGLRGLWDHAREILLHKEQSLVPHNRGMTFSCWLKPGKVADLEIRMDQKSTKK